MFCRQFILAFVCAILSFPVLCQERSDIREYDGRVPIQRVFGKITLGESTSASEIASSFGVPDIYYVYKYYDFSLVGFNAKIPFLNVVWHSVSVEYSSFDNEAESIIFSMHSDEIPLMEYETLKNKLMAEYGNCTETYSDNASYITCNWDDGRTALIMMLQKTEASPVKDKSGQYILKLCYTNKQHDFKPYQE